jgi:mono/diheme cytochrome c family protein
VGQLAGVSFVQRSMHSDPNDSLLVHRFFSAFLCAVASAVALAAENPTANVAPVTFYKDIAPILFRHCSTCHRPGQAAPFALIDYAEARKHAKDIVTVTHERRMPPWLPEPGFPKFANERRLSDQEIDTLQRWHAAGTPPGNPADSPPRPQWKEGWQLGPPDLIVRMPRSYELTPDGPDLYRNFVVPIPLRTNRYVRAVEFRPDNARIVHHTFIKVDRSGESRKLEGQDGVPGFAYMMTPSAAQIPEGHFLGWTPGQVVMVEPEELAWHLEPGTDLVLQMHLRRSGKTETLQPEVGLYFTDRAPTKSPFKLLLTSRAIDIGPGNTNYLVTDQCRLAADVDLLAILPHAHYLGREVEGIAVLPDGSEQPLLRIRNWDFNWQSDYRYAQPLFLPKGTLISARFRYDNSEGNPANANHPPRRVTYGPQSSDEMCELWLQVLPRKREDTAALASESQARMLRVFQGQNELALKLNPDDPVAHRQLGGILLGTGDFPGAMAHLQRAIELNPQDEDAHFYLGRLLRQQRRNSAAVREYEQVLAINHTNYQAHGNLGLIFLQQGDLDKAQQHFEAALTIFPEDKIARQNLEIIQQIRDKSPAPKGQISVAPTR